MSELSAIEVQRLDRRRRRVGPGAPHLIGVCGGSGSGKTVVVRAVEDALGKDHVLIVHQDSYYKDLAHLPFEQRAQTNFDHPSAFDSELLNRQLSELLEGKNIRQPVYDYKTHARSHEFVDLHPRDIILLDGILILDDPMVRELMDIRVFMDTDADTRLMRRIQRDMQERGRSLESVLEQYEKFVRPMHDQFVDPSRRWADIIIPHGGMNEIAVDMLITKVRALVIN
jgi:uridine kinase